MEYIIDDKYILEVNNSEYLTENKITYINKLVDRYKEFATNASNSHECLKLLREYYYMVV